MAEVYRGYHVALDRYVAIKLLHPFLADDPEFKDRFENEARNVAKLKHPNIVQVYDFEYDAEGDSYYMVMELINGPTLKDRLFDLTTAGEHFPTSESIRIVRSAADALAYAHQRNMIHRDVKPANLMLDEDQRVVLTDFGIAKIVTGAQFTASGGMVGTPAYMAPEQGLGEAGDERSDIYSLGVILFQMVTGRLPFDAETPLAVILKHVNEPVPSTRAIVPEIPEDLDGIIMRTLAKEPSERYQSADELVQDLSQLDETGKRHPLYSTPGMVPPPGMDRETRPAPPTPEQRAVLTGAATETPLIESDSLAVPATESPVEATPVLTSPEDVLAPGAPGRLRPAGVLSIALTVIVAVMAAFLVFGSNDGPLAALLDEDDTATPQRTPTELAQAASATNVPGDAATPNPPEPRPSATPRPTRPLTDTPEAAIAPSDTPVPSPSPTGTPTRTPTASRTPTVTRTPTPSRTPTPDLTGTARAHFFETAAAASPTPNITQTLVACDFEYIVIEPANYPAPPALTDFNDARLVPTGDRFELEIVLRNVGTCPWPENVRLSYNAELTNLPDSSINLDPVRAACEDRLRSGTNFALQQQPNFYLRDGVGVTEESGPLVFTGQAPDTFGCYYGVWDLLYPNSDVPIGRPLIIAIRVWEG